MPGLKSNSKHQGIDNVNEMIELRNSNEESRVVIDPVAENNNTSHDSRSAARLDNDKIDNNVIDNSDKRSSLYEKHRKSNGKNLRQRYNIGKLPRAHWALYQDIVMALDGKKRDIVLLKPILEKLDMNYMTSAKVFSLLEEYGYLYFERAQNEQGRLLIIENLHKI